jgi:hypothetical protein
VGEQPDRHHDNDRKTSAGNSTEQSQQFQHKHYQVACEKAGD